jgi:hypothetical protein
MVTANPEHGATDLDNDLIMPRSIRHSVFLAFAVCLSAPLAAQQAATTVDGNSGRKPLNLSLPRDVAASPGAITRQYPTPRDNLRVPSQPADASDKATTDRRRSKPRDDAFDAPYGTGFEARQRGFGARGSGGGFGGGAGGGFGGGGRGGGRGR